MEGHDHGDSITSEFKDDHNAGHTKLAIHGNNIRPTWGGPDSHTALQSLTAGSETSGSRSLLRKSSSTDTMRRVLIQPTEVRFAASPDIEVITRAVEKYTPSFRNPFSEDPEARSRKTSVSSEISDTVVPEGFAGHRDTFARLLAGKIDVDSDEERDLYNDTPTQAGYLLFHRRPFHLR